MALGTCEQALCSLAAPLCVGFNSKIFETGWYLCLRLVSSKKWISDLLTETLIGLGRHQRPRKLITAILV